MCQSGTVQAGPSQPLWALEVKAGATSQGKLGPLEAQGG